jgi:2-keto-4-pentenoate hydratase
VEQDALALAVRQVVECRLARRRLDRLVGVSTLEDGYAVQQRANAALEAKLGARVGHKIGGTTEAMRRYINVPEPLAGEVFASQVHASGAVVRRGDFVRLGIETEIAVRLGRDLPPRGTAYRRAEAAAAVAALMPAVELVDDRYEDFATVGGPTQIADNAFDAGSVLGPEHSGWQALALDLAALTARTWRDGVLVAEGRSDALLGHPLDALAWIANRRSSLGLGLAAGSFVSLGTITAVQWAAEGPATYTIEVERLGKVAVTVA